MQSLITNEGTFILEKMIGEGGQSRVFLSSHPFTGEPVAIKLPVNDAQKTLFLHEDSITKLITNPHVIRQRRVNDPLTGSLIGIIMPYYPYTLFNTNREILSIGKTIEILDQICQAVGKVHELGIVHRDIKDTNILISSNLEPVLADFGLAFFVGEDLGACPFGDLYHAAPEVFQNLPGKWSDTYALAILTYRLLNGQYPFIPYNIPENQLAQAYAMLHTYTEPPPIAMRVPLPFQEVIFRALRKNPVERPMAAEFGDQLVNALSISIFRWGIDKDQSLASLPKRVERRNKLFLQKTQKVQAQRFLLNER